MSIKKSVIFTLLSVLFWTSLATSQVKAREPEVTDDRKAAIKETINTNRINLEHTNADKEIDRRIAALNALSTRVNNMKRVSADEKATLTAQIQTVIASLTSLKAKIAADTDANTLKTDKQSIVSNYRVFLLLMPKIEIMAHADMILQLSSQMKTNNTALQTKIQAQQDAGKDVTALNKLLADRQASIADAQAKAQSVIDSVSALTPDGYPGNKASLTAARDLLKIARQDLTSSLQDLVKTNASLKTEK